jgi:hypothetical protein
MVKEFAVVFVKHLVLFMKLIVIGVFMLAVNVYSNDDYSTDLYSISMYDTGVFTVWVCEEEFKKQEHVLFMLTPPIVRTGDIFGPSETSNDMIVSREDKGDGKIITYKGTTDSVIFEKELVLSNDKITVTYNIETKKALNKCSVDFWISALFAIKDKKYELGSELDVPEETGNISGEALNFEGSPAYLKFFNLNKRDVEFTFPTASSVKLLPQQWWVDTYSKGKDCILVVSVFPDGMSKNIKPKTKGTVQFVVSFEKSKAEKKK